MINGSHTGVLRLFGLSAPHGAIAKVSELAVQIAQQRQSAGADAHRDVKNAAVIASVEESTFSREVGEISQALQDGTLSPLSERATKFDAQNIEGAAKRGLLFEGRFAEGVRAVGQPGDAKFADRQVAMLNAYHYVSDMVSEAVYAADLWTGIARGTDGPMLDYAVRATKEVERNASLLAVQFSFAADVLVKAADGTTAMQAFEVTHKTFGKMLSVDAAGTITFYDQAGTAYSAADYAAAQPDGIIPELMNDLAIKGGKLDARV